MELNLNLQDSERIVAPGASLSPMVSVPRRRMRAAPRRRWRVVPKSWWPGCWGEPAGRYSMDSEALSSIVLLRRLRTFVDARYIVHDRMALYFNSWNVSRVLVSIALSTASSFLAFFLGSESADDFSALRLSIFSLGLASAAYLALGQAFAWQERAERHRFSAKIYLSLLNDIGALLLLLRLHGEADGRISVGRRNLGGGEPERTQTEWVALMVSRVRDVQRSISAALEHSWREEKTPENESDEASTPFSQFGLYAKMRYGALIHFQFGDLEDAKLYEAFHARVEIFKGQRGTCCDTWSRWRCGWLGGCGAEPPSQEGIVTYDEVQTALHQERKASRDIERPATEVKLSTA
eukprot:scaffold189_cov249-Pinguiococcus_pyrenoidosus.AAC.28